MHTSLREALAALYSRFDADQLVERYSAAAWGVRDRIFSLATVMLINQFQANRRKAMCQTAPSQFFLLAMGAGSGNFLVQQVTDLGHLRF